MNLGELKTAVAAYAHRSDLGTMFPTFLELAEQRIYFGEANTPKVRTAAMRKTVSMPDGTRPVDFLDAVKIAEDGAPGRPLEYAPLALVASRRRAFSWDGETLVLSQDQAFPVDLSYYARLDTPVADTDTNGLMQNSPRLYLHAILVEAAMWSRDEALAAREAANYTSAALALNNHERSAALSGSPLRMRP